METVLMGKNSCPPSTDAATLALKQMKLWCHVSGGA